MRLASLILRISFPILFLPFSSVSAASAGLGEEELARKREGWYLTGLPLLNFSSDTGFGRGARVYFFENGSRSSARFQEIPYEISAYAQYFSTTEGWRFHRLSLDMPLLLEGPYRLRLSLDYDQNTARNYFGNGEETLRALPGSTYEKYYDLISAQEPLGPGSTNAWFNRYSLKRPGGMFQVERNFAAGWIIMLGFSAQDTSVETYDGKKVKVDGEERIQGTTRLSLESPRGISGGWINALRAGVGFDTRDFEPAPRRGWYSDLVLEAGLNALGSDYEFTRGTAAVRRYQPAIKGMVLAGRAAFTAVAGNPPFFDRSTFGFLDTRTEALGGGWTLRGYKNNRFSGRAASMANVEARWDLREIQWFGQRFLFTWILFSDAGRVFDSADSFVLHGWKAAGGGGMRIAWNQATILNLTYGKSGEDTNIFIDFGHQF